MRKLLTGVLGAIGVAALWRYLTRKPRRRAAAPAPEAAPDPDPAEELRRKLAEARETVDDRDEYDAAEGTPVDEVESRARSRSGAGRCTSRPRRRSAACSRRARTSGRPRGRGTGGRPV